MSKGKRFTVSFINRLIDFSSLDKKKSNKVKIFRVETIVLLSLLVTSFFIGCSKDLFYFPGTIQEEVNKAVDGGLDGIIVCVNQQGNTALY